MNENPLTQSHMVLARWSDRLPAVSARLYELDPDAWEVFEPARKKLHETLTWLHSEGYVDIDHDNVLEAAQKASTYFERIAWSEAADAARAALGIAALKQLVPMDG